MSLGFGMLRALLTGEADGHPNDRDPDFIRDQLPALWMLASMWFRPELTGLERLPAGGPVLLVGNDPCGAVGPATMVINLAHNTYFGADRSFFSVTRDPPAVPSGLLRRLGVLPATAKNVLAAVSTGSTVLLRATECLEPCRSTDAHRERKSPRCADFVRLAMAGDVPIAPVAVAGGAELTQLTAGFEALLGKLAQTGAPVGGTLPRRLLTMVGQLPVPSKIQVRVLEPFRVADRFGPRADPDEVYAAVIAQLRSAVDGLTMTRVLPIVG